MRTYFIGSIAGCITAVASLAVAAEPTLPQPRELAERYSNVPSLKFDVVVSGCLGEPSQENPLRKQGEVKYRSVGPNIWLDYQQKDEKENITWDETYAYNGSISQNWRRSQLNTLFIESGLQGGGPVNHYATFFDPFLFLLKDKTAGLDPMLTLPALSSEKNWQQAMSQWKPAGFGEVRGKRCLIVDTPGGKFQYSHDNVLFSYRVYLSLEDGFYPIQWETRNSQGEVFDRFELTELAKIAGFPVPIRSVLTTFGSKGNVEGVVEKELKNVEFGAEIPRELFTLDVSRASTVSDNGTWIDIK